MVGLLIGFLGTAAAWFLPAAERPNVILIVADDLGYGDLGCYGADDIPTPHIDRLARSGWRLTSFYVSQPVCTASRASLLSGCYANRIGLAGALNHTSRVGIHDEECLLSEVFRQRGYATAIFGKWHLGHQPGFLPTRQGFDEFFGIPYSNDNGPLHPVIRNIPPLPLYEAERIVATDPDQSQFTRWLTERTVQFIERQGERPFFVYLPHIMPHVPIFASAGFHGRSARGLYGDVVAELDWSVGEIVRTLERCGLRERTWLWFLSDNGPFLSYGEHAGRAGPLREGKLTTFEGGVRVPCVLSWPGRLPAGVSSDALVSALDVLPTLARVIGAELPARQIDGVDLWPWLSGEEGTRCPRDTFYYYSGDELHAVRHGPWKLHLPHDYLTVTGEPGRGGKPANSGKLQPLSIEESGIRGIASRHGYEVRSLPLSLYHLEHDLGERHNVADSHPEVVQRLLELAEAARLELGDSLTHRQGRGVRPAGRW